LDGTLGGASTHFAVDKNRVLKQTLDQNMPKNALLFKKKTVKIASLLGAEPGCNPRGRINTLCNR